MEKWFIDLKVCVTVEAENQEEAIKKLNDEGLTEVYDYDIEEEGIPRLKRYKDYRKK